MRKYDRMAVLLFLILGISLALVSSQGKNKASLPPDMVLVGGGMFLMGDVFGEGSENERPVHRVRVSDFLLAKYEVTLGEFKAFVQETGYRTSAEAPADPEATKRIEEKFQSGKLTPEEIGRLKNELLLLGGTGYWDAEKCQWTGYEPKVNWRNPGIRQSHRDPVVAVSAEDARRFCNWRSQKEGLPIAYDAAPGNMLDAEGRPTIDIAKVKGYRLPTEAEWEYAAREGGREVRFGNGNNIAKSSEINFRANAGDYSFLEIGEYRKGTTPVGQFAPNKLGLYDMCGNAWEWTGDVFAKYTAEDQVDPCGINGNRHALRGGRWGGDAFEARVFHRSSWVRNDRCNNSGFRIARSK